MKPFVISHISIANSLGIGTQATLKALQDKRSGLKPCDFETVKLDTYIGEVTELDKHAMRSDLSAYDCRNNRLAQLGLETDGFKDAVNQAKEKYGKGRIATFMGTSTSGILETEIAYRHRDPATGALPANFHYAEAQNTFSLGDFVQRYLRLTGPAFVVSSACSSTAKVFGNAIRMIEAGVCDAAVVGGVDSLCLTTLYGFSSLGLTSQRPCRPFDQDRDGISLGEGAGFALIERLSEKTSTSAALLLGVGESSDAYHMSTPHPEGMGAKLAMQKALSHAELKPEDISYINLHGTATKTNDASEDKAVDAIFGAYKTPCSSTKGWTGHLLGAAGITEAIISILALQNDFMPGSLHTQIIDPSIRSNYQLENRPSSLKYVLSNSFGFGGSNSSLILGRVDL